MALLNTVIVKFKERLLRWVAKDAGEGLLVGLTYRAALADRAFLWAGGRTGGEIKIKM